MLAGSRRVTDHTTFAELEWTRDRFALKSFQLPPGLQTRSHLLDEGLIEVLEDVQALQWIRDGRRWGDDDAMSMARINNHIASIQSRLVGLSDLSSAAGCCRLAAYLCSIMLCCKVWCGLVIPVSEFLGLGKPSLPFLRLWSWTKQLLTLSHRPMFHGNCS